MTNKNIASIFSELFTCSLDMHRAERIRNFVRPRLEDGDVIMRNSQIFRALVMKAPGVSLSYDGAKQIITDKIPEYSNNIILGSHPEWMPYMVALRAASLNVWSEKAYVNYQVCFDCDSKLWLTDKEKIWCEESGIKGVRTDKAIKPPQQKQTYLDVDGHTQFVKMPYFIQMGFCNRGKFTRMTKVPSLFLISEEIPYTSIESIPPLKKKSTQSGPSSSVPPEVIEGYTAPSVPPDVSKAVKAYKMMGASVSLPGFYKAPRP
ncbi:MAG TPA: hypothetical protein DCY07_02155 [Rhodospirillaceae bacterium]|nr:hypothetical protein [Rhodospirillaceae bacterium]